MHDKKNASGNPPHFQTQLLYSRKQVAKLLGGISPATVKRLERQGRLRPRRLTASSTSMVFFHREDVEAFLREAMD